MIAHGSSGLDPSSIRVKICGLKSAQTVEAAVASGAAYLGLNFFAKSPRAVSIPEARELALRVPAGIVKVGLVVDADDAFLEQILDAVPVDMLQLHGAEEPARVAEISASSGLPVMKAVAISCEDDLRKIDAFAQVASQLLIDAKAPPGALLPGGNGLTFDWRLIAGRRWAVPWMLAGGLTPENVGEAVRLTGATQVDVSSGVESAPGTKKAELIREFLTAARV